MENRNPLPIPPKLSDQHWQVVQHFVRDYDRVLSARFRIKAHDARGAQQNLFGNYFSSRRALDRLPPEYLDVIRRLPKTDREYRRSIGALFVQFIKLGVQRRGSVQKMMSAVMEVVVVAIRHELHLPYLPMPKKGRKALLLRIAALPLDLFDLSLAQHFHQASFEWALSASTEKERQARLRRCSNVFARACTLFTADRQKCYTVLPPRLWYFLNALRLHVPQRPSSARSWVHRFPAFMSALAGVRKTDTPVYIEIMINLYAGARVADGLAARTQNLSDLCATHHMIHGDEQNTRKRHDFATPPMPAKVFHDLKHLAGGRTYLISANVQDREQVHQRAIAFVREHLAGDNKQVMYLLRKIYVTALTHHYWGIAPVQEAMNHADQSTTEGYFIAEFTRAMYLLWLRGPLPDQAIDANSTV